MEKRPFPVFMNTVAVLTGGLAVLFWCFYQLDCRAWYLTAAISFGVTAYHFGMRLIVGYLVLALTQYRFDYRKFWFQPKYWEAELYRILRLRCWKRYLPTFNPRFYDLRINSLLQVIQNTCGAEIVHECIMALSFLPLLMVPRFGELGVFLITSVLSALVDGIFVLAQRYNRPRLVRIYEKQEGISL